MTINVDYDGETLVIEYGYNANYSGNDAREVVEGFNLPAGGGFTVTFTGTEKSDTEFNATSYTVNGTLDVSEGETFETLNVNITGSLVADEEDTEGFVFTVASDEVTGAGSVLSLKNGATPTPEYDLTGSATGTGADICQSIEAEPVVIEYPYTPAEVE